MKKLLLISLLLSLVSAVQAIEVIKIGWQDLQGTVEPYADPFKDLTEDQLYNLSIYARITEMQKYSPKSVTGAMDKEADTAKATLESEKIDIAYMFEQRDIIMKKRQKAAMATNSLLADREVEMAGYMLALEFDGELVKEFLLVPTVGACSHKPVPSSNQIILVKTKKPVKAGSAYLPIKITGTLRITPQAKDLYLVDGKKSIEMSYSMENTLVERYERNY